MISMADYIQEVLGSGRDNPVELGKSSGMFRSGIGAPSLLGRVARSVCTITGMRWRCLSEPARQCGVCAPAAPGFCVIVNERTLKIHAIIIT